MSIRSSLTINAVVTANNDVDLGTSRAQRAISAAISLLDGVDAGEADRVFADTRTLAASGTEDLDLSGALTDAFGVAQVFAKVKAIFVQAAIGNTNTVVVSRPAANGAPFFVAASDAIALRPGETFALVCDATDAAGRAITAGTGDLVTITNGAAGTSVTYSVLIVGTSA